MSDSKEARVATPAKSEAKAKQFGTNIESDLALELLRVVEKAAIASAKTMGQGERKLSDHVATESMRETMDTVPMHGTIVIGEGERDEAPMLYIGEKVGADFPDGMPVPDVDIAVDPLEGTNLCATGSPGAITVLAASERGGLLHAPDCYMEKIVVGPSCRNAVDLDAPVADNLKSIAKRLNRHVEELVVIVLDRPRHEKLIQDIRDAGARIRLITDGDLSAGIAAAVVGTGVHAVMGSGGAPEGVITAAAIRCLNGYMLGRLVLHKPELRERMQGMGIKDPDKIYTAEELAPGKQMIFTATGVTDSPLLRGVRFFGDGTRTSSVVMTLSSRKVRFLESINLNEGADVQVRFGY
ncbi:MAG TPA: class II fructose-bisphosphatase [Terriglobales bacterium]|nr:class II fructose-bisphosphatase [Terriglobales bacterium]